MRGKEHASLDEGSATESMGARDEGQDDLRVDMAALMQTHHARIRGLAWRFGVPRQELDDAVQDVFAAAWAGAATFRGDCATSTWLTRIAVNYFVSRHRAWMRRVRLFVRGGAAVESAVDPGGLTPAQAEAHARAVVCIRRLPEKLRAVFVLRYIEEMTAAEVSDVLGIPEATVRTRAFHARQQLRDMMRGYEP